MPTLPDARLVKALINLENRYGGLVTNVPRNHVSPYDPRTKEQLAKGGMIGGDRMSRHGYAPKYAQYLKKFLRKKDLVLVEVGILKGSGLAIWCDIFRNATIFGLDIDLDHFKNNKANLISLGAFRKNQPILFEFDQLAPIVPESLLQKIKETGIDIIIDDGLHTGKAITSTISTFKPFLNPGGLYIIEDNPMGGELSEPFFKNSTRVNEGELTIIVYNSINNASVMDELASNASLCGENIEPGLKMKTINDDCNSKIDSLHIDFNLFKPAFLKAHNGKFVSAESDKLLQMSIPAPANQLLLFYNEANLFIYSPHKKKFISSFTADHDIVYASIPSIYQIINKSPNTFLIKLKNLYLSARNESENWILRPSSSKSKTEEFSIETLDSISFPVVSLQDQDINLIRNALLTKLMSFETRLNSLEKRINDMAGTARKEVIYSFKYFEKADYKTAIIDYWFRRTGNILDFKNLHTFNEKIQAYKLYGDMERMGPLSDKVAVRDYVREKGYWHILLRDYGTYSLPEQIDYDLLPEKFAIKCNHGSGMNRFLTRGKFDRNQLSKILRTWLLTNYAFSNGFELQYKDIKPLILVEEFMPSPNLIDYKFWCFHGKVKYVGVIIERALGTPKIAFFDLDWVKQDFTYFFPGTTKKIEKPYDFDKMVAIAEDLADDFPHVRVDLYNPEPGVIYFGEMTFTSNSGFCDWSKPHIDKEFGDYMDIEYLLP